MDAVPADLPVPSSQHFPAMLPERLPCCYSLHASSVAPLCSGRRRPRWAWRPHRLPSLPGLRRTPCRLLRFHAALCRAHARVHRSGRDRQRSRNVPRPPRHRPGQGIRRAWPSPGPASVHRYTNGPGGADKQRGAGPRDAIRVGCASARRRGARAGGRLEHRYGTDVGRRAR